MPSLTPPPHRGRRCRAGREASYGIFSTKKRMLSLIKPRSAFIDDDLTTEGEDNCGGDVKPIMDHPFSKALVTREG
ncbi:hypothetical protein LINPERPRIM_LOCUS35718 [Linum perenne]